MYVVDVLALASLTSYVASGKYSISLDLSY